MEALILIYLIGIIIIGYYLKTPINNEYISNGGIPYDNHFIFIVSLFWPIFLSLYLIYVGLKGGIK